MISEVVPRVHLWHIADNKKSATSTTIHIIKGSVASVDSSGHSGSLVTVMFIKNSVFGFVENLTNRPEVSFVFSYLPRQN